MKTFRYKIACFTPGRLLIWSKEAQIESPNMVQAFKTLKKEHSEKGYLINVDYELIYLTEVWNDNNFYYNCYIANFNYSN